MTIVILLAVFVGCVLLGVPLFVALGLGSALALLNLPIQSVIPLAASSIANLDAFVLVAVPLFLLMGHIMTEGGLTTRLMDVSNIIVGRFRGGLAMTNVTGSLFFAGVSGSAIADLVAIGSVIIPAMKSQGYSAAFSGAITGASALLGPIIPPSILLIIYGVQAQVSIAQLFLAGVVPGLIIAAALLTYVYIVARHRNYPVHGKVTRAQAAAAVRGGGPSLLTPVIIILGIVYGVFTVTESAAIAVVYSLALTVMLYRTVGWASLQRAFLRTAHDTGVVMILVAISSVTAWIVALDGGALRMVQYLVDAGVGRTGFLLGINAVLLIVGMFIAPAAALLLVVPILIPVANAIGLDLIQLGLIAVVNLNMGLLTPPVAIANFITARIAGISLREQQREVWPLLLLLFAIVLLVTYVPALSLALPRWVLG